MTYQKRPVRFLQLAQHNGWTVKVHGISARTERPSPRIVAAALETALPKLPTPAVTDTRYGTAILVIHEGADAHWILLGWWRDREILQQRMFTSPLDAPEQLEEITEMGLVGCVWEMAVQAFERAAWVQHCLQRWPEIDLKSYLGQQLNEDV